MQHSSSFLVAVALSGGADSLFTLVRLHRAGVPVLGIHGRFAQHLGLGAQCAGADPLAVEAGLAAACQRLGVPFFVADCAEAFMQQVVTPFVQAYAKGNTPNPCAHCNATIKFGAFLQEAQKHGATHLATGHYVRLVPTFMEQASTPAANKADSSPLEQGLAAIYEGDTLLAALRHAPAIPLADAFGAFATMLERHALPQPLLLQGADVRKDQSYFLSLVPGAALAHALFPLGQAHKSVVLQELAALGFTPPQGKESQEVCFVPGDDYRAFVPPVAEQLGIALGQPGPVLLPDGTRLGTHQGLWQYTEGQRKGLGVCWKEPLYVLDKQRDANVLLLGPRGAEGIGGCVCREVNEAVPRHLWPQTLLAKTRYREAPKPCRAELVETASGPELHIHFLEPEDNVAPGQIAALYAPLHGHAEEDGRPVLCLVAGGVIASAVKR